MTTRDTFQTKIVGPIGQVLGYRNVYLVTDQPITALQQQFPCSPAHQVGSGNSTNNPSAKASAHLMRKKKRGSGKIYIKKKKKNLGNHLIKL